MNKVPQGGSIVNVIQYKKEAIHLSNRVNLLNLPYKNLLEPELSGFYCYQNGACARELVEKHLRLKKARIMRVDAGCMPRFLPNEVIYGFEWETLVNEVYEHIGQLEDEQTQFFPVFFVPLNDGWTVVDNVAALLKGNHE